MRAVLKSYMRLSGGLCAPSHLELTMLKQCALRLVIRKYGTIYYGLVLAAGPSGNLRYFSRSEYATFTRNATKYGQPPEGQVIWLQKLACSGNEQGNLGRCLSKAEHWAETDCSPAEIAAVTCSSEFSRLIYAMDFRLVDHY